MSLEINGDYASTEFVTTCWHSLVDEIKGENGYLISRKPFRHSVLPEFIAIKHHQQYFEQLLIELDQMDYCDKNNDLYQFRQSGDLKHCKSATVAIVREFFAGKVSQWLTRLTGIEFNDVSMSCSRYAFTDSLMCHDDKLDSRRVAYVLYLTPDWSAVDGGLLELFSSNDLFEPTDIASSIVPTQNTLVLFEVAPNSFHQVSEVLSRNKSRISLNGWFHSGSKVDYPSPVALTSPRSSLPGDFSFEELLTWINPVFLEPQTQSEVRRKFEINSEIQLQQFLQQEKYDAVLSDLGSLKNQSWNRCGPPNKRQVDLLNLDALDDDADIELSVSSIRKCMQLFHSDALMLILSQLTGMHFHSLAFCQPNASSTSAMVADVGNTTTSSDDESGGNRLKFNLAYPNCEKRPKVGDEHDQPNSESANFKLGTYNSEMRRWRHGCYTLISDSECGDQLMGCVLDANFYLCKQEVPEEVGGYTCYIVRDEDEQLLMVNPSRNCLALVCRDRNDTLRFVKRINSRFGSQEFFDIELTYLEYSDYPTSNDSS